MRQWHAQYYLAQAERAKLEFHGPQQVQWLQQLEAEQNNLRAALRWSLEAGQTAVGLRLASALWQFWEVRGHLSEGRGWLERALANASQPTLARAQALYGAGILAWYQSDYARATELYEESLALFRELGDKRGIACALEMIGLVASDEEHLTWAITTFEESLTLFRELGDKHGIATSLRYMGDVIRTQGHYKRAHALLGESLALSRELKDKLGIANSRSSMGEVIRAQGDYECAKRHFEDSLAMSRELDDKHGIATSLRRLGDVARIQGDSERAHALLEESLALFRDLGDKFCAAVTMSGFGRIAHNQGDCERASSLCEESIAVFRQLGVRRDIVICSLSTLGYVALSRCDYPRAQTLFNESLGLAWEESDKEGIGRGLLGLAGVAGLTGQLEQAARLLGSVEMFLEAGNRTMDWVDRVVQDRLAVTIRAQLDEATFAAAWAAGRVLKLEQAIAEALDLI
jgi:tetratricopeptide (TPR) repeat protein